MTDRKLFELRDVTVNAYTKPRGQGRSGWSKQVSSKLLDSLNLDIFEGEKIGILGSNGAGKTTLLRLLSGIYGPSSGTIRRECRPYGLFAIQEGLLMEADGVENIIALSVARGMTLPQAKQNIAKVARFARLGNVLKQPIKTYSTGMLLRLAVGISLKVEADFLLLDEWIGSGDVKFRNKLEKSLVDRLESGKGIVLASHNHNLLERRCDRGLVMRSGQIVFDGPIEEAIEFHQENRSS